MSNIRVLSLNCWGLKYISKDRHERIRAIADALSRSDYDIVTLQELWVFSDFELIRNAAASKLRYSKYFYSGALGAGLAILTRFPIVGSMIHPYSLNGHPMSPSADWFVGKAAASVTISHPQLEYIEVFNTHFVAGGGDGGPEHLRAHRIIHAWEFSKLVQDAASKGKFVIAAGDFNGIPSSLAMSIVRCHGGLTDAWESTKSSGSTATLNLTPENAIAIHGITCDSPLNSYSAGKPLDGIARKHHGKRLDYILYRQPFYSVASAGPRLVCTRTEVVLTDRVSGHNMSYSDHFGLESTLRIVTPFEDGGMASKSQDPPSGLTAEMASDVIRCLTACYRVSASRSKIELTQFAAGVLAVFALCIGSAWMPHAWINPIFLLATIAVSWYATTMLYVGFLYGNWERRALTSTIEEIELYKQVNLKPADSTAPPLPASPSIPLI